MKPKQAPGFRVSGAVGAEAARALELGVFGGLGSLLSAFCVWFKRHGASYITRAPCTACFMRRNKIGGLSNYARAFRCNFYDIQQQKPEGIVIRPLH